MIAEYEKQTRKIPTMFILHVGIDDQLLGHRKAAIVENLETRWDNRRNFQAVCFIFEVSARDKKKRRPKLRC